MDREAALDRIRALMAEYNIAADELTPASRQPASASGMARLFGYLGGVFLFAGVAAFVGLNWDAVPPPGRVLLTLGLGLATFVAAFTLRRSALLPVLYVPLLLIAELLQPTGMLVAFEEYGSGGDLRIAYALTAAVFGLQATAVQRLQPSPVLVFFGLLYFTWFAQTCADLLDLDADPTWIALGASLVLIAQGIGARRYPAIVRIWTMLGAGAFYVASFSFTEGGALELLFVLAAGGGVYASILFASTPLLVAATCALLAYISYFTAEYFSDALGWPLVLILIGVAFLVLGRFALGVRQRFAP